MNRTLRSIALLAACAILSGCFGFGRKEKVATTPPPAVDSECYTVDLFTEAKIEKPADTVPDAYRAFLGDWGKGAWNDVWCHDLRITKVQPDGKVELFEMHAPYPPWGQPATAFRRTARISRDGILHLAYGTETVNYQIVDGKLEGRRHGSLGNLKVSLVRRGAPPVPEARYAAAAPAPAPVAPDAAIAHPPAAPLPRPAPAAPPAAAPPPIPVPRLSDPGLPPIPPPRPTWILQAQATMTPET